jgi:hypothetical protein
MKPLSETFIPSVINNRHCLRSLGYLLEFGHHQQIITWFLDRVCGEGIESDEDHDFAIGMMIQKKLTSQDVERMVKIIGKQQK